MDLELSGKRAIVTGGSRGIGLAIAKQLAAEGVVVALAARDAAALAAAADEIRKAGGKASTHIVDTGSDESVKAMVAAAMAAMGGVDILVNAAAKPSGQSAPPPRPASSRCG